MIRMNNNLPSNYDTDYEVETEKWWRGIIAELSIVNDYIKWQITMPMVYEMDGGKLILDFFQNVVSAEILVFISAGLILPEFNEQYGDYLDEKTGLKTDVRFNNMGLYNISHDLGIMIDRYLIVMGNYGCDESKLYDKSDYHGNEKLFRVSGIFFQDDVQ